MKQHSENALAVANNQKSYPKVALVNYPGPPDNQGHELASRYLKGGYGALLGVGVKGGLKKERRSSMH